MRFTTDGLGVRQNLWGRTMAAAVAAIMGVTLLTTPGTSTAAEYVAFADPLVNSFDPFDMTLRNQAPVAAPDTLTRRLLDERLELRTLTPSTNAAEMGPIIRTATVERGDTIIDLLVRNGVAQEDAYALVDSMRKVFNPRSLKIGQEVTLTFPRQRAGGGSGPVTSFQMAIDAERQIRIERSGLQTSFTAVEVRKELNRQLALASGEIRSSLYEAAAAADLPVSMVSELIKPFSYDVDFQRDIQPGDRFEVLYERMVDEQGRAIRNGDVLAATLVVGGRSLTLYRFDDDWFDPNGKSVRKALLQTPIEGARLTSGFGARRHPLLGYTKMHKGVDFGAPTGTPIMAAGDGVVEKADWFSSYGKYVRIRHNGTYSTAYAHMSRINVRAGQKVKQGQVIGAVGTTGRSTGPHLHYEVLVNNKQVNPKSIKLPVGRTLAAAELKKFRQTVAQVEKQVASLRGASATLASTTTATPGRSTE
ncbi:MAG: peptidase M23 [Tistrella sp.]|uniref:Peptidase M23 n=2 Tax=Tistrella TaxID=171436 RepID=A0A3B9IQA6_9PROT|nr:peptidase M23 [Tistrella sp.]MBA76464.1 peptidase M23 [Tistrella sp.]HAE49920.1 peptidase M23 [Tistrella mobilis]